MTNAKKNAPLDYTTSELFDGEAPMSHETLSNLDEKQFARYAMIGDAMRARKEQAICIDITQNIAKALESEPTYNENNEFNALENQPAANHSDQGSNVVPLSRFRKPVAQFAIAASVCLVALIGVNTQNSPVEQGNTLPTLQTMPLTGSVSPVSLSTEQPAIDNAQQGLRELQQQRIGALVLEHQRQSRMAYALSQAKQNKAEKASQDVTKEQN
ncbi:Sigma factor RpoE negative regulatory protein RseA [Pseudoalteromonas luteoviolacea B = ATCC 29581]|nr:Sigma factor RpoE negative regulatory protein RseA [Pseudoalteromonas luteoviolacea B = ATCC 29581]